MVTDGVRVGSYLPTDGYLDPSQLTYALADGARRGGVQIFTHTRVLGIDVQDGAVSRVPHRMGRHRGEVVVNAAACTPPRSAGSPASASRSSRSPTSTS